MPKPTTTLTLYKNLSYRQPIDFTAATRERCLLELRVWATNNNGERSQAKLRLANGTIYTRYTSSWIERASLCDGLCIYPPYPNKDTDASAVLNYCESYKNWEIEYIPGELDIFDTFEEALDQFVAECRSSDDCWSEE